MKPAMLIVFKNLSRRVLSRFLLAVILCVSTFANVTLHGADMPSDQSALASELEYLASSLHGQFDHAHDVSKESADPVDHAYQHNPADHSHEVPGLVALTRADLSRLRPIHVPFGSRIRLAGPSRRLERPPMITLSV